MLPKHQPFATFMQPLQCDSRFSDAKHNSITLAAAAARNVDAAIPLRSADTELQSTIEVHTTTRTNCSDLQLQNRISTPKRKNDDFEARFKRNFKRKIINAKMKKSAAKAPFATFMKPLQCDSRLLDAKHNSIIRLQLQLRGTLTPAFPLRSAHTELQSTKEVRTTIRTNCSNLQLRRQSRKTTILKRVLKGILKGKSSMPK